MPTSFCEDHVVHKAGWVGQMLRSSRGREEHKMGLFRSKVSLHLTRVIKMLQLCNHLEYVNDDHGE